MDDLVVGEWLTVPAAELTWRFGTSGGPGGQHANKTATRAELRFDVARSRALSDDQRDLVRQRLEARLVDGVLVIRSDGSRSQWRNRQIARRRMVEVLSEALRPAAPSRRPTRPARSAIARRLRAKRARSEVKRLRRRPHRDD